MILMRLYCCALAMGTLLPAQDNKEPSEAEKRGTRFGETVRAAVVAAVPIADPILKVVDAFRKKPDPGDRKKLDEALATQKAALVAAANAQLKRLSVNVDEIRAVKDLGDKSRVAERSLTVVQSNLLAKLSEDGWVEIGKRWRDARKSVEGVASFDASRIHATDVQTQFKTLKNTVDTTLSRIDDQMERKDNYNALALVTNLLDRMSIITEAPGVHLGSFGDQLEALASGVEVPVTKSVSAPPPPPLGPSPLGVLLERANRI